LAHEAGALARLHLEQDGAGGFGPQKPHRSADRGPSTPLRQAAFINAKRGEERDKLLATASHNVSANPSMSRLRYCEVTCTAVRNEVQGQCFRSRLNVAQRYSATKKKGLRSYSQALIL
jgi:hypothetical protein